MTRFLDLTEDFDAEGLAGGGMGIFGLPKDRARSRFHILPVPFEATCSYRGGTARGPGKIRRVSDQVDLFDLDTGHPYREGIFLLPELKAIKDLDVTAKAAAATARQSKSDTARAKAVKRVDAAGAKLNTIVRRAAERSLDQGHLVGLVGGDHSVPYGLIELMAERHDELGILHFDAHHDLRPAFEGFEWSHASVMYNVMTRTDVARLVQVGVRDVAESEHAMVEASDRRIIAHRDQEIKRAGYEGVSFADVARSIVEDLPRDVYVSLDVDGLDPKLCPNTGTPVPGGLDFPEIVHILSEVIASGRRIVGFDLVEVSGTAEWDAVVGARLLYKLIGFMRNSQA